MCRTLFVSAQISFMDSFSSNFIRNDAYLVCYSCVWQNEKKIKWRKRKRPNESKNAADEFYCTTFNLIHRSQNKWNECSYIAYRVAIKQTNKCRKAKSVEKKKVKWSYATVCCNFIITIWHARNKNEEESKLSTYSHWTLSTSIANRIRIRSGTLINFVSWWRFRLFIFFPIITVLMWFLLNY